MASVAATVIGAPITAVLIVLELTQSYAYAVAAHGRDDLDAINASIIWSFLF